MCHNCVTIFLIAHKSFRKLNYGLLIKMSNHQKKNTNLFLVINDKKHIIRNSTEPRDYIYAKSYECLFFPNNICKNLSNKQRPKVREKRFLIVQKSATDAFETTSKNKNKKKKKIEQIVI